MPVCLCAVQVCAMTINLCSVIWNSIVIVIHEFSFAPSRFTFCHVINVSRYYFIQLCFPIIKRECCRDGCLFVQFENISSVGMFRWLLTWLEQSVTMWLWWERPPYIICPLIIFCTTIVFWLCMCMCVVCPIFMYHAKHSSPINKMRSILFNSFTSLFDRHHWREFCMYSNYISMPHVCRPFVLLLTWMCRVDRSR